MEYGRAASPRTAYRTGDGMTCRPAGVKVPWEPPKLAGPAAAELPVPPSAVTQIATTGKIR